MPHILKFYFKHCLIGFAIAALFTAGVFYLNVANLWHLISRSDMGLVAALMFWFFNGIVFAGVQTAVAVMAMAEPGKPPRGGTPIRMARVQAASASRDAPSVSSSNFPR